MRSLEKKTRGFIFSSNSIETANQQYKLPVQPFLGYRVYMLAKLLAVGDRLLGTDNDGASRFQV